MNVLNWFEALILGIIQGISEFLPVSSTAHLVIAERLLHLQIDGSNTLTFEVFLHFSSLLAVIFYFRKDIFTLIQHFFKYLMTKKKQYYVNYKFSLFILLATLLTMIAGKGLETLLGDRLVHMATISASLIITGIFLIFIEHGIDEGNRKEGEMTLKDAIVVGLGQALAVIPGISRSGSTLILSLWCGMAKETAVRYSFLLSIPLILGITLIKIPEFIEAGYSEGILPLAVSFAASFVFAIIGIKWLIQMVKRTRLSYFAFYCIALGIFTWIFLADAPVSLQ